MGKWSKAVVGYVFWAAIRFQAMKQFVSLKWWEFGIVECVLLKLSIFVILFETEVTKNKVLDQSHGLSRAKMLFLNAWSPDLDLAQEDFSTIPVWIKLPNLKLYYYFAITLSKLASYAGKPLYTDKLIVEQSRLSFARVCIEICNLPDKIPFVNEKGESVFQSVTYE
ncbi:hypothetical protein ACH5RR_029394 [Cinchona calisaya]|uniref:DUF4283 domain-containing protein n=1 Tax=Cinchona calisaya TaxID=153742 RepID=A0ABD2YSQ1_9GENT